MPNLFKAICDGFQTCGKPPKGADARRKTVPGTAGFQAALARETRAVPAAAA
jgi:hypothetical protein